MRILALSSWWPEPADNGSRLRISNLLRMLAQRHEVHLVSFTQEPLVQQQREAAQAYCASVATAQQRAWTPRKGEALASLWRAEPAYLRGTYSDEFAALVGERARAVRPDAVVAFQLAAAPYALAVPGARRVLEEVEVWKFHQDPTHRQSASRLARAYLTWWKFRSYLRRLLPRFDACTVVSGLERSFLESLSPRGMPIAVVPNGADTSAAAAFHGEPQPDTLIYPGALSYDSNFDAVQYFLRDVYPLVRAERPDVKLRVTGKVEPGQRAALGEAGVEWTGYVPDVRPVVAGSWAEVVPLRSGGGTRLKVLEALSLGTPVVSTGKGVEGLELVAGKHALVADSPASFARATTRLLSDRALREELATEGRKLVRDRYDWQVVGAGLEQVLASTQPAGAGRTL